MASFETGEMADSLPAVTNGGGPPKDQAAYDLARSKGWSVPVPDNNGAVDKVADSQPADGEFINDAEAEWAHAAEKYEWKEDYGDVGPPLPALEAQLFNNEYKMQKGNLFEK